MASPSPSFLSGIETPLPTPTYGPGGSFTVWCADRIAASPRECLEITTRAGEYPSWNRFCRKCTIDSQPEDDAAADNGTLRLGTRFTFDVHMDTDEPDDAAGRPTALEVSVLEPVDDRRPARRPPAAAPGAAGGDAQGGEEAGEGDGGGSGGGSGGRTGWRIAWVQRPSLLMPGWMLHVERVQEFVEAAGGAETDYYCWETFYGLLAPVVRRVAGKQVEKGFGVWVDGLRRRAEKAGQPAAA